MGRFLAFLCLAWACLAVPAGAQRRQVLPQIREPHPYYYREMYLPQLTSGPSSLSWSADSTELVYSMAGSLWRQKVDSTSATQLTDGAGYDYQPDWSRDGQSIVYVSYQKDAMELCLLDATTGKTSQLTSDGAVNLEPRWSPDGKRILWTSTKSNGRFHIFVADFAGGTLKNVTRLTGEQNSSLPRYYYSAYDMEINPTWTPDGKEILFVSNRGHIHGTGGFWRMKAEPGAEAREIHYEETNWKARPDFSPDGSRMVYSSYLGREWHSLWVIPAGGGDAFPISYGSWDETNPRWSPDGKKIAFISNKNGNTEICVQYAVGASERALNTERRDFLRPHFKTTIDLDAVEGGGAVGRVSVVDQRGKSYAPWNVWIQADDGFDRSKQAFESHYFYSKQNSLLDVPEGKYVVTVTRGFETRAVIRTVEVKASQKNEFTFALKRLDWGAEKNGTWIGSDLHVHMNYGGDYRATRAGLIEQGRAEGLGIINQLTVNKEQRFPDIGFLDFEKPSSLTGTSVLQGQEFHTSYWGHRGIVGLEDHLLLPGYAGYPNTAAASLFPMNADVYDMAHAQGALVGAVHPFDEIPDPLVKPAQRITDELPVDVALGKLDYMEIVGFSDHKSTAEVWYKLLNLGFKLPAGAGTDATTNYAAPIRGQVGFNRVYALVEGGPATVDRWMEALKSGKTFATNGPLLEFTLGGQIVGSELQFDAPRAAIPFTAKLRSIVPVDHLEVVCNGKVTQTLKLEGARDTSDISGTIPLNESGWCVLRAWTDKDVWPVLDRYAYATTSPVYVTVGGKRAYSRIDAEYFKAWIDRTIEVTSAYADWNSPDEKARVIGKLREARAVYEGLH